MNRLSCQNALLGAFITCIAITVPAAAQQLTIYGTFNFNTWSINGVNGSGLSAKGAWHGTIIQGDLVQGAYKITGVSSTTGLSPGMMLSGSGIPAGAVIIDVSGAMLLISKSITATATGVPISVTNGNATLATSHTDGLAGNIPVAVTCSLDSGVHYSFDAATTTPFPAQANATIYAGKLMVNAAISINKQVWVTDTLLLNAGNLTIPSADSLVISSGYAIAGAPFNSSKHIVTAVDTGSNTQGWLIVQHIDSAYLFPVGTANHYLPATLHPLATGTYAVRAFEGITVNAEPGGTAFTAAQKSTVADAVWNIVRRTNDTSTCHITLQWPQALEGNDFSQAGHIGIAVYGTSWKAPAGSGNNTTNTAAICTVSSGAFYVGEKITGHDRKMMELANDIINRFYPNPVSDHLIIEHGLQGKITITVYDLLGRVLINEYHNALRTVLHTAALKSGVYILQVSNGIQTTTRKFIKE
jgi:hypothetical protein